MSDNTGRPGSLPGPPPQPTETTRVPAPPGATRRRAGQLPGNFALQGSRPPDRGRSTEDALEELQRRRTQSEPGRRKRKPRAETYVAPDGTRIPLPAAPAPASSPQAPPAAGAVPAPAAQPATSQGTTAAALASLLQPGAAPANLNVTPTPAPSPQAQPAAAPAAAPADARALLAAGDAMQPVAVNIGGQVVNLPLGEVVNGYLRGRDYQQKTQQAAAEFRSAREMHAQFNAAREKLEQRLAVVLANDNEEFSKPIDWEALAKADPIGCIQKQARYQARQQLLAEQRQLAELRGNEEAGRKLYAVETGHTTLCALIPGWADLPTRGLIQQRMLQHLTQRGFTGQELAKREMTDPREVIILLESMLWAHHATQPIPQPQPVGAATLPSNGAWGVPGTRETAPVDMQGLDERFTRTRKLDDAVELLQARRVAADYNGTGAAFAPMRPNRH